jgi:hypothetical protein
MVSPEVTMSIDPVSLSFSLPVAATLFSRRTAGQIVPAHRDVREGEIRRYDGEIVHIQAEDALARARARALGDVARTNVKEIADTQDYIDGFASSGKLRGTSHDAAMDVLKILGHGLRHNGEHFTRSIL